MTTRLSIIIPVYRVEQTLDRCLESIASQTFRDWQAIVVDDGSPDGCPAICDEWARRDARFKVVHKTNGGLSDARNAGLEQAEGDYVTFVDSDDYLAPDTYEQLMQLMAAHPEYDLLEYSFEKVFPGGNRETVILPDCTYTDSAAYWLDGQAYLHTFAWNKVCRKALFRNVRFPVGHLFEDVHTLPLLLQNARTVATTRRGTYLYCINPKGITANAKAAEWTSLLKGHLKAAEQMQLLAQPLSPAATSYYLQLVNIQLSTCALSGDAPSLPQRRPLPLRAGTTWAAKLKIIFINLFGLKALCNTYKTLYHLRRGRRSSVSS